MSLSLRTGSGPIVVLAAFVMLLTSGCGGESSGGNASRQDGSGQAEERTVEVYFTYTPPRAPCNASCEDINVRLSGFRSNTNYSYSTNIESSVDGSIVGGNVGTNGDGRAEKRVAVYNTAVYDETYCVTVDGVQGCKKGN